ncbi:MAG: hypothetical protein SPJ89_09360 [Treponema sp.]|nr:hypothetical protein [Spirochaetia bacterium]MDD7459860.1 hypothetical protein [Spirochaetales bacterium]MDY5812172.1 hypothetical protein [Treponema sp.]
MNTAFFYFVYNYSTLKSRTHFRRTFKSTPVEINAIDSMFSGRMNLGPDIQVACVVVRSETACDNSL